jgi:hypothetical protein
VSILGRGSRGCYELQLGNGSILPWRLENHTQAMFPTKSGRSLPLIWPSFEKTLHSATTNCARSSTGSEVDRAHRLCLALHATRPSAAVGSCLPTDEEVALCWRLRSDGPRSLRILLLRLSEGRASDPTAAILESRTLGSTPESGSRAATTGQSARKVRRYTRRWILWGICSPCSSVRPMSRSGLGWRTRRGRHRRV